MATNKVGWKPSPDEIVAQAKLLTPAELKQVTEQLLALQDQHQTAPQPSDEAQLLQKIQLRWSPETQARYDELVALRREERITPAELQELVSLSDEAERRNVQRVEALATLARLRQVSLDEVMQQLGIVAPHVI